MDLEMPMLLTGAWSGLNLAPSCLGASCMPTTKSAKKTHENGKN